MSSTHQLLNSGRYLINRSDSLNGSGTLFQAVDTEGNTRVVIREVVVPLNKVATAAHQEQLKQEFAQKANKLVSLRHPSLLTVSEHFSEIGSHFLVMEALEGSTLAELVQNRSPLLTPETVLEWAEILLDGLALLHSAEPPMIHGEIDPYSILITKSGRPKLSGHGIGDESMQVRATIAVNKDKDGLHFLPLEKIYKDLDPASQRVISNNYDENAISSLTSSLDGSSDLYSLGSVLYFALSGAKPLDALERAIEIRDGRPDPLAKLYLVNPEVSPEFSQAIHDAITIERDNRYQSAAAMKRALRLAFLANKRSVSTVTASASLPTDKVESDSEADLLKRKLKELEEQRRLAEERAEEAERRLREQANEIVAAVEEPESELVSSAELLEIPTIHSSQGGQLRPAYEPIDLKPVEQVSLEAGDGGSELEIEADDESQLLNGSATQDRNMADESVVPDQIESPTTNVEQKAEVFSQFEPFRAHEPVADSTYAEVEADGKGRLYAMAAGAVVILIIIVGGAYIMLSGASSSSDPAPSVAAETEQNSLPLGTSAPESEASETGIETTRSVQTESENSTTTRPEPPIGASASDKQQRRPAAQPAPATQQRPAPETARTPQPQPTQRRVTVDDLINDN